MLWVPRIIELNGQKPPLTYKRFQAIISRMELPKKPVGAVSSQQMESCRAEIQENHDDTYGVPSLEELGACAFPSPIRVSFSVKLVHVIGLKTTERQSGNNPRPPTSPP